MPNLLKEIRNQPEHVRHIFMWLCVVTTFSMISFVWFKSTQAKFVAMLHPQEMQEQPANHFANRDLKKTDEANALAESSKKDLSPLASIMNSFSLLRASISELVGGRQTNVEKQSGSQPQSSKGQLNNSVLPLSEDK